MSLTNLANELRHHVPAFASNVCHKLFSWTFTSSTSATSTLPGTVILLHEVAESQRCAMREEFGEGAAPR
eukprot:CAMPEP_0115459366 /NCGR_PEP_ID=MMETSP0271-20121206/46216_1 /TAXON_ID=71861 /ORGANISM="Scrippsiella trochoidea, Strain CCMP3099" /LENGTH=69 /DNA_ID=CAMNT_0002886009 /DNA_START=197 /DNA_END=404 /DNA_ORIENTATION=-